MSLMEKQREQSRAAWKGSGEREIPEVYRQICTRGLTTAFLGYETTQADSEIIAMVSGGEEIGSASEEMAVEVLTAGTPFYGAAGGQVGDTGVIAGLVGKNRRLRYLKAARKPDRSRRQGRIRVFPRRRYGSSGR